jgi:uncharacterized coiled-coil DUF342 family protein
MSEKRDEFILKMQMKLDELNDSIDALEVKAEDASTEARKEYLERVADAKAKRDQMSEKLAEVKQASGDAWEELQGGLQTSWDALSSSVKAAVEKFRD